MSESICFSSFYTGARSGAGTLITGGSHSDAHREETFVPECAGTEYPHQAMKKMTHEIPLKGTKVNCRLLINMIGHCLVLFLWFQREFTSKKWTG